MKRLSFDQRFAIAATVAVVAGLIAGFWVLGTPGRQRLITSDRQRIQDLRNIAFDLYNTAQDQGSDYTLPTSLDKNDRQRDPITDELYEYQRLSDTTYELCAEFATDSSTYPLQNNSPDAEQWQHPEGRHCFEFDINERP